MSENQPIVLTVAGLDPCAGAGVLADMKSFEHLNVYGMAVMTANTLQTENCFYNIDWQPIQSIRKSIDVLMQAYKIVVVKIGIVKDAFCLQQIIEALKANDPACYVIWDPIITSSSGFTFFNMDDAYLLPNILSKIDLITPNIQEYQLLQTYIPKDTSVLVKGGHRKAQKGLDILKIKGNEISIPPEKIQTYPKHGSGCVLSAAIASYIARGESTEAACKNAKLYTERFLASHTGLLGKHHYDHK